MLYGTRRVGKTTLIQTIAENHKNDVLVLQGEDLQVTEILQQRTIRNYERLIRGKKIVIIDEAQAVPEIGLILKLMIDGIKGITIIATGSRSFNLVAAAGGTLVGRQKIFELYPIAQCELSENLLETNNNLEERLIYGSYPELWQLSGAEEKETYLKQLVKSYLLKDILTYENVKAADLLYKLLQLLAFRVGSEVSMVELGISLQLNKVTVERYLDLLSKVFIIYPLSGYSNNLRKEITKSKKWYFHDNGIRNALINNFNSLQNRNDIGQLWEQYFISERIKYNSYNGYKPEYYFWRTYDQQEIDLVEVNSKKEISAFECKWKDNKKKAPIGFTKAYPDATFTVVTQNSYLDFIS